MSISEEISYDKEGQPVRFPRFRRLFLPLVIILVAVLSFGIGRLSIVTKGEPVKIEFDSTLLGKTAASTTEAATVIEAIQTQSRSVKTGQVIVSKNGTKYHYLNCPGAKQIKEENKIVFGSAAEAEGAGYTLAANCKP